MKPDEFRTLRLRLGYSQAQAAEAVRQSKSSIVRIEAGGGDVPGAVGAALEYHAALVAAGLHQRIPARKAGRPRSP